MVRACACQADPCALLPACTPWRLVAGATGAGGRQGCRQGLCFFLASRASAAIPGSSDHRVIGSSERRGIGPSSSMPQPCLKDCLRRHVRDKSGQARAGPTGTGRLPPPLAAFRTVAGMHAPGQSAGHALDIGLLVVLSHLSKAGKSCTLLFCPWETVIFPPYKTRS